MTAIRTPRTVAAAADLLERYAAIDDVIADTEGERNAAIAEINARADSELGPLIAERDAIRDKLAPWWSKAGAGLTAGKRKSIELGGCIVGTRAGRDALVVDGDEAQIIETLQGLRWAKALLRVNTSLNRPAALQAMDGAHGEELQALGFAKVAGGETFYVQRAEQRGTLARA